MPKNEVVICPPTLDVEQCDWTITQQKALPTKIVGVVYTKKCPWDAEYDYEKLILCEKVTGTKVLVESWVDTTDPTQVRTTRYTYLASNSLFLWNPDTDLENCGWEKLDIQTEQYCDWTETVLGTLVWDVTTAIPALIGIVFHKIDGSVHTPVAPVAWACVLTTPDRDVAVITDCVGTTVPTPVNGKIAEEVIIGGSTQTLNVRIVEDCEIKTELDYEYICNKTTWFYDLHTFSTVDGVANPTPTITATTITCDVAQIDFETQSYCNITTGTTWIRSVSFTQAWLETVLSDVDTTIPCIPANTTRPLDIITDCAGTTSTIVVDSKVPQEVVISPTQAVKVVIDKSCEAPQIAQVPNCTGTLDDKPVDEINAVYLLNQENKHTETVYDVLTAVIGGAITYTYTAPLKVALTLNTVTVANDTLVYMRTDFGDGYSDVGDSPSHTYNYDWSYEIKTYAVMASWNKVLLLAKEIVIVAWVMVYSPIINPAPVSRTYKIEVACALQDYCGGVLVGSPYNADGSAYTLIGDLDLCTPVVIDELEDNAEFAGSDCNLYPITECFCAMVSGSATKKEAVAKSFAKEVVVAKEAVAVKWAVTKEWAITKEALSKAVRAVAVSTKPVKATICKTLRYDCSQTVVATTYTIAGKPYTSAQFVLIKYTVIECNTPTPTYSAGAVTCTTYPDPIDWIVVLNATVYTNDSNPSDVQTIYTLASTYPTVWGIGDIYLVADELLLVDCPPGSIVETEACFKALVDIAGVAATGDMINVQSVQNLTAGSTWYTITHVSSWAIIYSGIDPVVDAGIDTSNVAEWVSVPCVATPPTVYQLFEKEVCATVDWDPQNYEIIKVYTRDPVTWELSVIRYEDIFWNAITGVVVEAVCNCSSIPYGSVIAPIANRRSDSYWPLMAQYQTWINDAQYDSIYAWRWPVGAPRAHYYRVKVYNASNTLLSTTVLWGYPVDVSNATYLQFLNDLSALTTSVWVTFTWPTANTWWRGGYQIEYDNTTGFSIILEHWIDNHAGWVIRNPDIKQAIRYESSRAEIKDSVNITWDLNNPAADVGWREWTNMFWVYPNDNITII